MQNYYFAGCCLRIFGDIDCIDKSRFLSFENVAPYNTVIELNVRKAPCPEYEDLIHVTSGGGIRIGRTQKGKWVFQSMDVGNACSIEACWDYSHLQGYADASKYGDEKALMENFSQLMRIAIECHLAGDVGVTVHASCIQYQGRAVLFTAPSGTGKSTQAEIWQSHLGATILSGDRPFLRVLAESIQAYGMPWDGKEQIFLQEHFPAAAIVEIRRAKRNAVRRLGEEQIFKLLTSQCFIPMWDDALKFSVMNTIRIISKKVPFYRLFCLPEEDAMELLKDVLYMERTSQLERELEDMKIKEGFILKRVADEWIVMPMGSNIEKFEGAIVLNDVAAFIWEQLKKPVSKEDLLQSVLEEYEIDEKTATTDLDMLLEKLKTLKILQD